MKRKETHLAENRSSRVVLESATGTTEKSSVRLSLTLVVEDVEFDVQVCLLRIKGRNIEENQHVKVKIPFKDIPIIFE